MVQVDAHHDQDDKGVQPTGLDCLQHTPVGIMAVIPPQRAIDLHRGEYPNACPAAWQSDPLSANTVRCGHLIKYQNEHASKHKDTQCVK